MFGCWLLACLFVRLVFVDWSGLCFVGCVCLFVCLACVVCVCVGWWFVGGCL